MEARLTKAQAVLLADVERHATLKNGGFYLRDMRRNGAAIALERLGLVERDWPAPTGRPGHHRILMRITAAGRSALSQHQGGTDEA